MIKTYRFSTIAGLVAVYAMQGVLAVPAREIHRTLGLTRKQAAVLNLSRYGLVYHDRYYFIMPAIIGGIEE